MIDARIRRLEQAYRADPSEANRLAWLNAKRAAEGEDAGPPDLAGKRVMVRGYRGRWPSHFLGKGPVDELKQRGAVVVQEVSEALDVLVLGHGRQKGKAEAQRAGEAIQAGGGALLIVDEEGLHELLRPDLRGVRFVFAGGFECAPGAAGPAAMVESVGAEVSERVDDATEFLVVGPRQAKGKTALVRAGEAARAKGTGLRILDEETFVSLLSTFPVRAEETLVDMPGLLLQLQKQADGPRLKKAVKMLTKSALKLRAHVADDRLRGLAPSQTTSEGYGLFLTREGEYFCGGYNSYAQRVGECGGQGRRPCKHLITFCLGLAQAGHVETATIASWLGKACERDPVPELEANAPIEEIRATKRGAPGWIDVVTDPAAFKGA